MLGLAQRVHLSRDDLLAALPAGQQFDVIVSNPPYVAEGDSHLDQGDLRFEPPTALSSGADGLDIIRRLVKGADNHLVPGGWLLMEHGFDQAEAVRALLEENDFQRIASHRDLAGIERVTMGRIRSD